MAGDAHLEVVFGTQSAETCGRQMYVVFPGLRISVMHFTTLQGDAVAEIPVIRQHRVAATAVSRKGKSGPRVPGGRMVRLQGGSNCGDVSIDYFQYPNRMRRLLKDQRTRDWSRDLVIVQDIGNYVLARRRQSRVCKIGVCKIGAR